MNKKSFLIGTLLGLVIGAVSTFTVLCIVGTANNTEDTSIHSSADKKPDGFKGFEHPISYEGKKKVSVKVMQVFDDFALAIEEGTRFDDEILYDGKVVMIIGGNHYIDEVININSPQQIGLYTYFNRYNRQMTVPVIQEIDEEIEKL